MREHLTKIHGWDGLTTVQLKRKRENMEIADVLSRCTPSDNRQKTARINEVLKNSV